MMSGRAARWILACALAAAAPAAAQPSLEYDVKAALLLNFARFIEWPVGAFSNERAPITVCVFRSNPFGGTLERVLQGETIHDRRLTTRVVSGEADSESCHLLFVPEGVEARAGALLRHRGSHAVTVGESSRFETMGGAVTLVLDAGRIRFNVNLEPIEARGVRVSARMLKLANRVDKASPEK